MKSQKPLLTPSKHNFPDASNKPQGKNEYSSAITPLAILGSLISFGLMHFPMLTGSRRQSITAVMDNRAGNRWQ